MIQLKNLDIKNFKIDNPICTDVASYLIGDKDSIDKKRIEIENDRDHYLKLTKYIIVDPEDYDPNILISTQAPYDKKYENLNLNFNENFFYINTGTDGCMPFFHFVKNKSIVSFFWPLILSFSAKISFSRDSFSQRLFNNSSSESIV